MVPSRRSCPAGRKAAHVVGGIDAGAAVAADAASRRDRRDRRVPVASARRDARRSPNAEGSRSLLACARREDRREAGERRSDASARPRTGEGGQVGGSYPRCSCPAIGVTLAAWGDLLTMTARSRPRASDGRPLPIAIRSRVGRSSASPLKSARASTRSSLVTSSTARGLRTAD